MSLTTDMKTLIPIAVAVQTDIYRNDMPDLDNIIGIYQTGGFDSSHSFNRVEFEEPTFQVMIRNMVSDTAVSKAEAIKDALDGQTNLTINSNFYLNIFSQGDILPLGKDDKNRTEVSLNFRVRVKRG
jgi:hypothetical protein